MEIQTKGLIHDGYDGYDGYVGVNNGSFTFIMQASEVGCRVETEREDLGRHLRASMYLLRANV